MNFPRPPEGPPPTTPERDTRGDRGHKILGAEDPLAVRLNDLRHHRPAESPSISMPSHRYRVSPSRSVDGPIHDSHSELSDL